jgi:alpha-beta hydrolase superfamily lysophospholipase
MSSTSAINPALVSDAAAQYKAFLSKLPPSIGNVHLTAAGKDAVVATARLANRDLNANRTRGALQQFVALPSSGAAFSPSLPNPLGFETLIYSLSPNGSKSIVFRKDDKSKLFLEIWTKESLTGAAKLAHSVNIDAKLMGDPLNDGWFAATGDGGVAWTDDSKYCAFVAEAAPLDSSPLYENVAKPPVSPTAAAAAGGAAGSAAASSTTANDKPPAGLTNLWSREGGGVPTGAARETWGERYENVRSPRIFILEVETASIYPLPGVSNEDALSLGQATWAPVATSSPSERWYVMAFTAWPHADRRLGSVYCYHRPCFISVVDLTAWLGYQSKKKQNGAAKKGGSTTESTKEEAPAVTHTVVSAFEHKMGSASGASAPAFGSVGGDLPVMIARSPRFVPASTLDDPFTVRLIYLTVTGPNILTHGGNSQLSTAVLEVPGLSSSSSSLKLKCQPTHIRLSLVTVNEGFKKEPFYLFTHMLPSKPFLKASLPTTRQLLLNAVIKGRNIPVVISLTFSGDPVGNAFPLDFLAKGTNNGSAAIVGMLHQHQAKGDDQWSTAIAVSRSTPTQPETLSLYLLQSSASNSAESWKEIPLLAPSYDAAGEKREASIFDNLSWQDIFIDYKDSHDPSIMRQVHCSLIVNKTKEATKLHQRLLVVPHGGPHSSFTSDFIPSYAFLPLLGTLDVPSVVAGGNGNGGSPTNGGSGKTNPPLSPFACLLVNFTGSTGWTEESNAILPGRIGELDSGEVHIATLTALALGGDAGAYEELMKGVESHLLMYGSEEEKKAKSRKVPAKITFVSNGAATTFDAAADKAKLVGHLEQSFRQQVSKLDSSGGDGSGMTHGGVSIVGGSHGGFLTAHAITQYPTTYTAACLRNPVTNLVTLLGTSDISDWTLMEGLGVEKTWKRVEKYLKKKTADDKKPAAASTSTDDSSKGTSLAKAYTDSQAEFYFRSFAQALLRAMTPDQELLSQLFNVSPMSLVERNKTPSLLVLGLKDKRVPPTQGLEWHYALRGREGEVLSEVVAFPEDVHAVDKPASEAEAWAHMAAWLTDHATKASATTATATTTH